MTCRPALGLMLSVLAGLALAAWPGCGGSETLKLCGEIPEGGCPVGRGGSCEDRLCAGLFDCVDGKWLEIEPCPSSTGGVADAGRGDAGVDGSCSPVSINHRGEVNGCRPDLQEPDCPASAAEGCAVPACLTGCTDFFLCAKDGWTAVAYCDEQGQLVVMQ